jgi:hypothetical protein
MESVADIGALHARYVRQSDRFKSVWTFHQYAAGVYKNFFDEPLPYSIDFQKQYERIKAVSGLLNGAQLAAANSALDLNDTALDRAAAAVLAADDRIPPSMLRRFFEKLKRTDDNIIHHLLKFYFYADAVEGDRRDKVDFLFTRLGEEFFVEHGQFWSRDSLQFRERIAALVSVMRVAPPPEEEVIRLIRAIRSMRDEVEQVHQFEELTDRHLLRNARTFKHRIGDIYFHPDVLLAIVELNVSTKNRFVRLYTNDESRMLEDAQNLSEHGEAIERNFGGTNPHLVEEMVRFREFKQRFDESRAQSNIKHDVITSLKASMSNILTQLDRGLGSNAEAPDASEEPELAAAFFEEAQREDQLKDHFGASDPLLEFVKRIAASLEPAGPSFTVEQILEMPAVAELRLEPWEIRAFQKLFSGREAEGEEDNEQLWTLFVRAAALRNRVDEEATILATSMAAGVRVDRELMERAQVSLDLAKQFDEEFGDLLHEAVYGTNPTFLHQLYRSRFRLLRTFSGLWLVYDRVSSPG